MTEAEVLQRGRWAQVLRENALLTELLTGLESEAIDRWKRNDDPGERDRDWFRVQAIAELRERIESAIGGSKLVQARQARQTRRTT